MKRNWYLLLIAAALAVAAPTVATAYTEITSDVTVPTTWTLANSPYWVKNSIQVASGIALDIEEGSAVYFSAGASLTVNGGLNAVGSSGTTITFDGYNDAVWGGIRFASGSYGTIEHATIDGASANTNGGGIYTAASNLDLNYCTIQNCTAVAASGGGIYVASGDVDLSYCTIEDNSAGSSGGGIYVATGDADLSYCTIEDNSASNHGGGICVASSGDLYLSNCTVKDNSANSNGGGVFVHMDNGLTTHVVLGSFENNTAGGEGESIYALGPMDSKLSMLGVSVIGGTCSGRLVSVHYAEIEINGGSFTGGGSAYAQAAVWVFGTDGSLGNWYNVDITDCTFSGFAAAYTDVITVEATTYGDFRLTGCEITGNPGNTDMVYCNVSYALVDRCTIAGNGTTGGGKSVHNDLVAHVVSSICWSGNTAELDGVTSATYSDIYQSSGTYSGTGNVNSNPKFVDAANGDYTLLSDSPCIDAGDPSYTDNDGTPRDMGAHYFHHKNVSGNLTTRTWTTVGGPYFINGATTVLAGNTLTIDPGVEVLFNADARFTVDGTIYAAGTSASRIEFRKNRASEWGGIRIANGTTGNYIIYTDISDGDADAAGYRNGGGIYVSGSTTVLHLTNSTVQNCRATSGGGGIYVASGTLYMNNSTVKGCTKSGIYIAGGTVDIDAGSVEDCSNTYDRGGGICASAGTVTIDNITITGNTCDNEGGGVAVCGANVDVTGCLIVDNYGGYGGGLYCSSGTLDMIHLTVCDNDADDASGVYREGGTVTLLNSIVYDNSGVDMRGTISATYSCIQGGWSGTGNISSDPILDANYRPPYNSPVVTAASDGSDMGCYQYTPRPVANLARPDGFSVSQNQPNPFNPTTVIPYALPSSSPVNISVYNVAGQLVRTLVNQDMDAGFHTATWNGTDSRGQNVSTGVYIYRVTTSRGVVTRRMVLAR